MLQCLGVPENAASARQWEMGVCSNPWRFWADQDINTPVSLSSLADFKWKFEDKQKYALNVQVWRTVNHTESLSAAAELG